MMIKYGLMNLEGSQVCFNIFTDREALEKHYAHELGYSPVTYKIVKVCIDEEPPTLVVKDDLSDRQIMFLSDDGGDPKLFDHMAQAKERIDKEGDLYRHIGRMECVFKPIEEM